MRNSSAVDKGKKFQYVSGRDFKKQAVCLCAGDGEVGRHGFFCGHGVTVLKKEILITRDAIHKRVKELAEQISSDYEGKEPVLIGVLNGAIFFFADLAREISIPTKMDFIKAASYGSEMTSSGTIRLVRDLKIPIQGKPVILVEDIVDTGSTLAYIIDDLERNKTESIRTCALIDKLERRSITLPIDYCGFTIKQGFVVGYGLDYDERFRCLPDIYTLK